MTRKEAERVLGNLKLYHDDDNEIWEALCMAIEALKEMPVEEYRQRLMEVFHNSDHDELLTYVVMPKEEEFKSLEDILRQYKFEPRPHGEWIFHKYDKDYECSNCHVRFDRTQIYTEKRFENALWAKMEIYNFCPNCGSDNRPKEGEKND